MSLRSYCSTIKLLHQHRLIERIIPMRFSSTKSPKDFSTGSLHSSQEGSDDQSGKMRGWQIHEYGGVEILQCSNNIKIPTITSPNEVCVEVHTASVNPIDVAMMGMFLRRRKKNTLDICINTETFSIYQVAMDRPY